MDNNNNNEEQELYNKFVQVLNEKLDNKPSAQDLNVILNFLKYNGIQASMKHEGLSSLADKATQLPFDDEEDEMPLRRIK